ncbi:hypothetical protein BD410DRAFT_236433 [Rickenella mellea]|uniref:REJ domain-containing protein n=1 Tax=Rickenella mellea TaxID=50990 RepID=A0A4Y7QN08_9AGAM|nr:hypothetical protein BD410DRAFT_236433 [Rickenella mellea]
MAVTPSPSTASTTAAETTSPTPSRTASDSATPSSPSTPPPTTSDTTPTTSDASPTPSPPPPTNSPTPTPSTSSPFTPPSTTPTPPPSPTTHSSSGNSSPAIDSSSTDFTVPSSSTLSATRSRSSPTVASLLTTTVVTTGTNGIPSTFTEIVTNPTLSADGGGKSSSQFFANKGAVAGVFLIVGLAAASILLWILFAVRRRRRMKHLERDATVAATLAAVGMHRGPLDDDDDDEQGHRDRIASIGSARDIEMAQRSSSGLGFGAVGAATAIPAGAAVAPSRYHDSSHSEEDPAYDPYAGYVQPRAASRYSVNRAAQEGYAPARTTSPTPSSPRLGASLSGHGHDGTGGSVSPAGDGDRKGGSSLGDHMRTYSMSSYEPLIAATSSRSPPPTPGAAAGGTRRPTPPPRNPLRKTNSRSPSVPRRLSRDEKPQEQAHDTNVGYAYIPDVDAQPDERLDPHMDSRLRRRENYHDEDDLRDDKDYSRPVLGVRNLPDNRSVSEYSHD